jgi:hypothetical protein
MAQAPKTNMTIRGETHPIWPGPIHPQWHAAAAEKGYHVLARVKNKDNLALACKKCRGTFVCRHSVLTGFQPQCPNCKEARWIADAKVNRLTFVKRDEKDRHYGHFLVSCGHTKRLQFSRTKKVATEGGEIVCESCTIERYKREARAYGWELVGPDPEGDNDYRLYRHADGCGESCRVLIGNMKTQRFQCPSCGKGWSNEPSSIYFAEIDLGKRTVLKLGFSGNTYSRFEYQLFVRKVLPYRILAEIHFPTGRAALRAEKKVHKRLIERFPDGVVPHTVYRKHLKVKSEIYRPELRDAIFAELAEVERRLST